MKKLLSVLLSVMLCMCYDVGSMESVLRYRVSG